MKSPLNNTSEVVLEKNVSVDEIVNGYNAEFNIDVKKYFPGLKEIQIYRCKDTGFRFYYPFTVSGDSDFYIHFQKFDWYYMPWKWEHQICSSYIKPDYSVLEVGCAEGAFLKKINKDIGANCVGLELNESCVLNSPNLKIENIPIQDFSKTNAGKFDLVCTFQVLEHIAEVNSFIKTQVDCLKKGGLLVICVPNNESVLLKSQTSLLNLPPHHMCLWNENSLKSLQNYFDIKLKTFHFEPLQKYHYDWYIGIKLKKLFGNFLTNHILNVANRLGLKKALHKRLDKKAERIIGHSIMAVYEKL